MADFDGDTNPFNEHGKKDKATGGGDETIPLIPGGGGGDTRVNPYGDQSGERETSFGGGRGGLVTGLRTKVLKEQVKGLYVKLAKVIGQSPEVLHSDLFAVRGKDLYYVGPDKKLDKAPLTRRGRLKTVGVIAGLLGKEGLCEMGFDVPKSSDSVRRALMKMPSASDIGRVSDIEMQDLTGRAIAVNEDLIHEISSDQGTQTGEDNPEMPTMREIVGLDKQLRSIQGSLKVEAAKKVELEQHIEREKTKLSRIANDPEYDEGILDDIRNRIERLNDDLKARQESIDVLKG